VLTIAKELGYQANPIAKSLRMRRTATIGVVVQGLKLNARRIEAAERLAATREYQLLLAMSRWEANREENEIRRLLRRRVDGLLLLSPALDTEGYETIESLVRQNFPLVTIGKPPYEGVDYVDWDRPDMFKRLTAHLLDQGCRRIVFLGRQADQQVSGRIEGVRAAMAGVPGAELRIAGCDERPEVVRQFDIPPDERGPNWVEQTVRRLNARAASQLRPLFEQCWPEAVVCQTDLLAVAAMQVAHGMGLRVPDQVAVTGTSDEDYTEFLPVPLTTVRMPHEAMVEAAMTLLMDRIEKKENTDVFPARLVPAELVIRKSSLFGHGKSGK
jgi:LacI family transcriptional regulator